MLTVRVCALLPGSVNATSNVYVPACGASKLIACDLSDSSGTVTGPAVLVHCTLVNAPDVVPPVGVQLANAATADLPTVTVAGANSLSAAPLVTQLTLAARAANTFSTASLLVTLPTLLATSTEKRAPSSVKAALMTAYDAPVAPEISTPLRRHW